MSALNIVLHPLTIVNISDHFTRSKIRSKTNATVYGALLGFQSGRKVEIFTSFELVIGDEEGEKTVDPEFVHMKLEQYKRGYETIEVMGWYSTGSELDKNALALQQQMEAFNETPVYLVLDPSADESQRDLPISVFETTVKMQDGEAVRSFKPVAYNIDSSDAERIAVDHISRVSAGAGSKMVSHVTNVQSSIHILNDRMALLAKYLEDVKGGKLVADPAIIRSIGALTQLLPVIDSPQFDKDFLTEYTDAMLITYLTAITKTSAALTEMLDKFNVAHDRSSGGGGMHGRRARNH
eukprot:TRINITY_DN178_c0_g8_i1.p1 TRINITY_DN178_c0_g8~~TRINITY_DN178_c0_g8_i1.p1  ORF type:complete len:325 (+),score=92.48 TRINITY_DN178_c0_g8_i1:93-977(+)